MELKNLANLLGANVASRLTPQDTIICVYGDVWCPGSEYVCSGFFECTVWDCQVNETFICDQYFSCNFAHGGDDFTCRGVYSVTHCYGTPPTSIPCPGIP